VCLCQINNKKLSFQIEETKRRKKEEDILINLFIDNSSFFIIPCTVKGKNKNFFLSVFMPAAVLEITRVNQVLSAHQISNASKEPS